MIYFVYFICVINDTIIAKLMPRIVFSSFSYQMLHIKKQSVLGVAAEGANVCRHGKLCWLQVKNSF